MTFFGTRNDELTNLRLIFKRFDSTAHGAMIKIADYKEAQVENEKGFGIFWTVNGFKENSIRESGFGRSIENVCEIYSWAMENDLDTIKDQASKIKALGLSPSLVIRSKRSLQAYWNAKNGTKENYKEITSMLQKLLNGDNKITHPAVVLRAPFYSHMKNPIKPFVCSIVHQSESIYEEEFFTNALKKKCKELGLLERPSKKRELPEIFSNEDQKIVLARLSGASELNGDKIEFARSGPNKYNIVVNGKTCEAWVDEFGKIGSRSGGGPTALQWISYYGYSKEQAKEILRRYDG